jgi:hypothetical protein
VVAKDTRVRSRISGGKDRKFSTVYCAVTISVRAGGDDAAKDPRRSNAQLAVKARCAYYILDQTRKGMETEEIEVRVAELEKATERQNVGRRKW